MSNKKEIHAATSFIDMQEEDLKSFLLSRYEYLKTIDEEQKEDDYLKDLTEKLNEYKQSAYTDRRKSTKAEIKAARAVAKARGIKFTLPEGFK